MIKSKWILAALMAILLFSVSCMGSKAQRKSSGDYTYKTECLGAELDGSQTLKAWGNGRNRYDAIAQARKNAIRDVLFFGIIDGKPGCQAKPLVPEVNAQDKYEEYFNKFFTDGGEYENFISNKDERSTSRISRDRRPGRSSVTHGLVVRVLRSELKAKLIKDGILKQN